MLNEKMKRAGVVLSGFWVLVGGYFTYLQNSNQDHWDTVRQICALGSPATCAEMTEQANELFSPDWATIIMTVGMGLIAIWLVLFAIAWVQRGSVAE